LDRFRLPIVQLVAGDAELFEKCHTRVLHAGIQ
jgi:hypothetical protein